MSRGKNDACIRVLSYSMNKAHVTILGTHVHVLQGLFAARPLSLVEETKSGT